MYTLLKKLVLFAKSDLLHSLDFLPLWNRCFISQTDLKTDQPEIAARAAIQVHIVHGTQQRHVRTSFGAHYLYIWLSVLGLLVNICFTV